MWEDDYVLRAVRQLAEAIARIAGRNRRAEHDQALADADQAWSELLDLPPGLINAVDSRTLAGMLRDPARIRLAARLSHEQARALAGQGDARAAALRSRRALELLREAQALQPGEDDADLLRELEAAARAEPAGPPGSSTGR